MFGLRAGCEAEGPQRGQRTSTSSLLRYWRGQVASSQLLNSHAYLSISRFKAFRSAGTNVSNNTQAAETHPVAIRLLSERAIRFPFNDCPYKDCRYLHLHNFAISKRVAQRRQYVSGLLKRYLLQPLADTT
jgi:hypothetical protein